MQQVSELYTQLLSLPNHYFETKLTVDEAEYLEDQLFYVKTRIEVFRDGPAIGATPSQEVSLAIRDPGLTFPRMAEIRLYTRVSGILEGQSAESKSEWIPQGVFYSDTKENTKNDGGIETCTIHGYDAMLKAERDYDTTSLDWPALDTAILAEVASAMGVSIDSRTYSVMTARYRLPLPTGYSYREVLSILASKYLGFFIITDEGKLLLQSAIALPPDTSFLVTETGNYITFGGTRIRL